MLGPLPALEPACDVQVSVAGVRLARGGVYIDVLLQADATLDPCEIGRWLAWRLHYMSGDDHEPGDAFELSAPDGARVGLLRPRTRAVDYGHSPLPGYVPALVGGCWAIDERSAVQTFVFGTESDLRPGVYSVRITEFCERSLNSGRAPTGASPPLEPQARVCVDKARKRLEAQGP